MNTPMNPQMNAQLMAELASVTQHLQRSTVQLQGHRFGSGSGVIWSADGLILTNAHVVRGREAIVHLWDGQTFKARVVRKDRQLDLAALVVNAKHLSAAAPGDANDLRVGQLVLAVGNPQGLHNAARLGMIHTIAPATQRRWIQADLRLAPGDSGGALATIDGQVVGINSMIVDGRAFAISSQVIDRFLASQADHPYLGITLQPVVISLESKPMPGWLIASVTANSPAETSGLMLGDVLIGIQAQCFNDHRDLDDWLTLAGPGDQWQLKLVRAGQRFDRSIVLGNQETGMEAA
ncbi:MAG: PDZ domain-containing protein [Cyanobacteria bacterium CRU_2_1]|nr:PDZ domain-containing protein [Cyanobacteria bacterium RU_5_0]NJR59455.1 PDZ domain-containing protein [Cyanobacteria bacterium CRU_2_1]